LLLLLPLLPALLLRRRTLHALKQWVICLGHCLLLLLLLTAACSDNMCAVAAFWTPLLPLLTIAVGQWHFTSTGMLLLLLAAIDRWAATAPNA
jgi:hypothetical protein